MNLYDPVSDPNRRSVTQALRVDAKLRNEAIAAFGLGIGRSLDTVQMFSQGQPVDEKLRDELLAKCAAGQYVELDVPMLAYEQKPGQPNRNFVRVRDGNIMKFARSADNNPFLRDHEQQDSLAVSGRIIKSQATKLENDGGYEIFQTARLTEPGAVSRALRGLMSTVSISWRSTDMKVDCSVCGTQVFTDCYHLPGQPLREVTNDGKKSYVTDRKNPTLRAEWVYNDVEHIETSETPVPAVKNAKIDAVRNACLSAGLADGFEEDLGEKPVPPPEKTDMSEELIKSLTAQVARLNKIADLSDAEKAYFRTLGAEQADAFLSKSSADRAAMFQIVYTAKNGTIYTAVDDKRLVQMAKDRDEDNVKNAQALQEAKMANLVQRATTELAHINGTVESRAALLGAVESIENAEHRVAALAALAAIEEKQAGAFVRQGTGGKVNPKKTSGAALSLDEQMEALAAEVRKDEPSLSYDEAYVKACESDKGRAIYAQMNEEYREKNVRN